MKKLKIFHLKMKKLESALRIRGFPEKEIKSTLHLWKEGKISKIYIKNEDGKIECFYPPIFQR